MRRLTLSVLSLAFLAACQPAVTELTEEQKAEIADELTQVMDGIGASFRELDVERFLTYFQKGDELTFVQDGIVTRSWDGFADLKRAAWAGFASVERIEYDLQTQVLAGNAGVITMTFTNGATATTGDAVEGRGIFTAVCSELDGEWKIVYGVEYFELLESPS